MPEFPAGPPAADRLPDVTGPFGSGWDVFPRLRPGNVDQSATIAAWIVHLPASHPIWPTYLFGTITLEDIPGQSRPANRQYPEAEFEFIIVALNPEHRVDINDRETWHHLTPINVAVQFDYAPTIDPAEKRRHAADTTRLAVVAATAGVMGVEPDDDARVRPWWTAAFRNSTDHLLGLHDDHG